LQHVLKSFHEALEMLGVATILPCADSAPAHQLLFPDCKLLKRNGERGRNRTFNLLIKSQLLCQLSYAPLLWNQSDEGHHRKQYQCNTRDFAASPRRQIHRGLTFRSSGVKAAGVQEYQSRHQGKNSNLSFFLEI
jgi:hypothetical protein